MATTVETLTIVRDALTASIQALNSIPAGDPDMPAVLRFMVGRKQFEFSGPLRRAQAMVELSQELRQVQRELAVAQQSENGSTFFRLGVR